MASGTLYGRYRLYKEGTTKLVNWLVKTANSCCDVTSMIKSLQRQNEAGTKTKKGKRASTPGAEIKGPIQLLSHELVSLAEAIAAADPPANIPSAILEIVKEVIAGRQSCAGWYAAQSVTGDGELAKANAGHAHFIKILEKVRNTLEFTIRKARANSPATPPSIGPTSVVAAESNKGGGLTNLFSCLELEKPTDSPRGNAPFTRINNNTTFELHDEGD